MGRRGVATLASVVNLWIGLVVLRKDERIMHITGKGYGQFGVWVLVILVGLLASGGLALAYEPWQPDDGSVVLEDLDNLLGQLAAMVRGLR
mgnify:CR=1 FL=1